MVGVGGTRAIVDFNAIPSGAYPPPSPNQAAAVGVTHDVAQRVQQAQQLPVLAGPQGSQDRMMQEEIKSKPIIQNGFTCISREQEEVDKTLFMDLFPFFDQ